MSYRISIFAATISLLTAEIAVGDGLCLGGSGSACPVTYPPGHSYMGQSYWAIGNNSFNTTILSFVGKLSVPEAPTVNGSISGVQAINPSMENTVRF